MSLVFHLFQMSDCPSTLFWILWTPLSERRSSVGAFDFKTHPYSDPHGLASLLPSVCSAALTTHRGSSSVARAVHTTLHNTDGAEQQRVTRGLKTFPAYILPGIYLSATHCAGLKEWLPQVIGRQWLKGDDRVPRGKYTRLTVLGTRTNSSLEWVYPIPLTWMGRGTNLGRVLLSGGRWGLKQRTSSHHIQLHQLPLGNTEV